MSLALILESTWNKGFLFVKPYLKTIFHMCLEMLSNTKRKTLECFN
jgi:hypothetical protein